MTERPTIVVRVSSDMPGGYLELVRDAGNCDMPACHYSATVREVLYRSGHERIGRYLCALHGRALYGRDVGRRR